VFKYLLNDTLNFVVRCLVYVMGKVPLLRSLSVTLPVICAGTAGPPLYVNANRSIPLVNSHAPHNDVSVNDGPHIRRWPHNIIIQYVV